MLIRCKRLALAQTKAVGDGRVATALEALAAVCLEAGEAAEAAECCARAMLQGTDGKLRVGDGGGLLLRARAFAQRGDWATADSQLNAALEVPPQPRLSVSPTVTPTQWVARCSLEDDEVQPS